MEKIIITVAVLLALTAFSVLTRHKIKKKSKADKPELERVTELLQKIEAYNGRNAGERK